MSYSKGQGATEYLVVLGAVLLVSLVVVQAVSSSTSSGIALKEQQSSSYWKTATPFSITTYSLEAGTLVATIKNQQNEPLKLTAVQINDNGTAMAVWAGSKVFGAGEESALYMRYGPNNGCKNSDAGTPFEAAQVTFVYDKSNGLQSFSQAGIKPLSGKCAQTTGLYFNPPSPADGASASTASYGANITLNATIDGTTAATLKEFGLMWNNTNTPFYDSSLVLALNFDDAYSTTTSSAPDCPTNWTLVPGQANLGGTSVGTNDFCVMTYEARNIGGVPVSTANGTAPWAYINQMNAANACSALGAGYHLISDPEWVTIANNVAGVAANWNSSIVGAGSIKQGNTGVNSSVSYWYSDNDPDAGISNSTAQLVLSNGQTIWHFSGNMWEWTDGAVFENKTGTGPDGDDSAGITGGQMPTNGTLLRGAYFEYPEITNFNAMNYSRLPDASWNSNRGVGQIYLDPDTASDGGVVHAFLRGGKRGQGASVGAFSLTLSAAPAYSASAVGFRCARSFPATNSTFDSARKVTDTSRYKNDGTIYGNTVLLMHMDENAGTTAYDESVYRNNGTCYNMGLGGTGVTNCNWTAGKSGSGMQFDGADDYVNGSIANLNQTSSATLGAWFKTTALQSNRYIVSLPRNTSAGQNGFDLNIANSTHVSCYTRNGSAYLVPTYSFNYADDVWHNLACVFNSTNACLFVDGVVRSCVMNTGGLLWVLPELNIGRFGTYNSTPVYFNGTIDEFMIANRSFSASEVLAQYNAGRAKHADWTNDSKWGSGAMKFDGVNDYVSVNDSESWNFGSNDFAIELWVNQRSSSTDQVYLSQLTSNSLYWQVYYNSDDRLGFNAYAPLFDVYVRPSNMTLNQWNHLAFVRRSNAFYIYLNGIQVLSSAVSGSVPNPTAPLKIGMFDYIGGCNYLNGSIDEVRVWKRTISAAEVKQHYYSSLNKFAPDRWVFTSNQTGLPAGIHTYYLYANGSDGSSDYTDERVLRVS